MRAIVTPHAIAGTVAVPGSKSHTIRAVVIATMAEGTSTIRNPLASEDCISATRACSLLGAQVSLANEVWTITGTGGNLKTPDNVIDVGNSGTTLYFVAAMAGLLPTWSVLTGDAQIRNRPISTLLNGLAELGAEGFTTRGGTACPAVLRGPIHAGTTHFDGKFSQYISAVLLSSPLVDGTVRIEVADPKERPYLQMTVDWMKQQGITLDYDTQGYHYFEVKGKQAYKPVNTNIPSDWEGVAFPLAAAVLTDSVLTIEDLDFSGSQGDAVIVDILQEMGANIELDQANNRMTIRGGAPLRGVTVDVSDIPDAVPILAVLASFAQGQTLLTNAEMVRVKETDRVAMMKLELGKMGVRIEDTHDSMTIYGGSQVTGALVDSHGDHRIAMALAVAGLAAKGETTVLEAESCAVSFPNFFDLMNKVGAGIKLEA